MFFYWFYFQNGRLNMKYLIRSCDAVRHLKNDVYLSYRLLEHVADAIGAKYGSLHMWIGNLHCFMSDLYFLKKCVGSK
jgi:thymidylate synthase